MSSLADTHIFNNKDRLIEGWYWAYKSRDLKKGKIVNLDFLTLKLALYRGSDDRVRAVEAFCPHMGAHLAEGKVEGTGVRCFFHHWKYDERGDLVDIPCQKNLSVKSKIKTYPCEEQNGMIWIYTAEKANAPLPFIHELKDYKLDWAHGNTFEKGCHPSVVMINAIDAHHFTSVHKLPVDVKFKVTEHAKNCIQFDNITYIPKKKWYLRLYAKLYKKALTYSMTYWNASTGSVTVGPDFLHCHIIFALRPTLDGKTCGQTILVTKKRGLLGKFINPVILFATKCVGNYFAHGDTKIFETINYSFKTPIKEDHSIIEFIKHTEKQNTCDWGGYKKFQEAQISKTPFLSSPSSEVIHEH